MQEQQKNLKIYLNNIPYDQKNIVNEHILKLIKTNELWVNSGVAKNKDDTFYCYIEVIGYTAIGSNLHRIRILFPHNYPVAPPQFNLAYNPDQYAIENQQILINDRLISLETNSANELQINLQLPVLRNYWKSQKRNANDAYIQLQKSLNNPPLLTAKVQNNYAIRQSTTFYNSNSFADKFMQQIQLRALKLKDSEDQIGKSQREIDYNISRVDFFKRNLPKLSKAMKTYEQNTKYKVSELQSINEELTIKRNCDVLLELSETQKKKIKILASRQGYKEGERRLSRCLEKELPENTCNFGDFRNIIRGLYQKMFESQKEFLKISD